MMFRRIITAGLTAGSIVLFGGSALSAGQADYDRAIGQVSAAYEMHKTCKGVTAIGGGDYQPYIMAATELLFKQGLRRNKTKRLLFYGQTKWIDQMRSEALAARGINADDTGKLCALAKKIAGQDDAIGRFLIGK